MTCQCDSMTASGGVIKECDKASDCTQLSSSTIVELSKINSEILTSDD
jgi:hypothetical protein